MAPASVALFLILPIRAFCGAEIAPFSKALVKSSDCRAKAKCRELQESTETAQAAYDEGKTVLALLSAQYDDIISWAEMYDAASMEAKK